MPQMRDLRLNHRMLLKHGEAPMRFRRWPRPAGFEDTSRKRLAFARKQRLERKSLPLFADQIAEEQHGADEEMARRALSWERAERESRAWRSALAGGEGKPFFLAGCTAPESPNGLGRVSLSGRPFVFRRIPALHRTR